MNEITHDQARRSLHALADGLLGEKELEMLQIHLRDCEACQLEADHLEALQRELSTTFHSRWDSVPVSAQKKRLPLPAPGLTRLRLGAAAFNLLLLVLWVWLYRAVFGYLRIIFSHEEFRTNQILLASVVVLIVLQFRKQKLQPRIDSLPQIYWPGLVLMLGGSAAYLVVERYLDINTFSATLFGLATYGLMGLWMSPHRWREGLPAALLLIGVLPFGDHLQTFVGYPMRIFTAAIVQSGLESFGIQAIGVDTILVLESGLAQVDLPCSGVKSLWTGMLFLIAATWLKRHSVNLRWFGTVLFLGGMLFLANIARVAVLVVVDQVIGSKLFAELIHVPLGVVAFLVACGAALLLLQRHAPETTAVQAGSILNREAQAQRPFWFAPVLASMLALMALLYQPQPQTVSAQASIEWAFPAQMHAQPSPLTPELYAWVTQDGAEMADRWNFRWEDGESSTSGALMFLTSSTWRGQHRPERCFEVQGQKVESSQTVMFAEDLPARFLHLSRGPVQVSALYWFQTGNRVTDDFATRIWADLAPENQRWVLVTILLNELYPADDDGLQSIAVAVRSVVANSMKGELP